MICSNWPPECRRSNASNWISSDRHCFRDVAPLCTISMLGAIDEAGNVDSFGSIGAAAAAAAAVVADAAVVAVAIVDDDSGIRLALSLDSGFCVATIACYSDCSMHGCGDCLCFGDCWCRASSPIVV